MLSENECSALLSKKDNLDDIPGILFVPHGEGIRQLVFQLLYVLSHHKELKQWTEVRITDFNKNRGRIQVVKGLNSIMNTFLQLQ